MSSSVRANNGQANMTGNDLRCMICTKTTRFSDISHLLTHISSKQHLSNYFKIRVAADENPDSQNLLNRFNSWFEKWNMGVLLRERLHQKEKKKAGARAAGRKPTVPSLTSRAVSRPKARSNENVAALKSYSRSADRANLRANFNGIPIGLHYNPTGPLQPLFPPVPNWSTSRPHIKLEPEEDSSELGDFDSQSLGPPAYYLRGRATLANDDDSALASSSLHSSTLLEEATEEEKDMTKLKGIIWPGMDLFDSATPEMQRKRNQKKATNVVALLQAASLVVDPDELIFNTSGEILKLREITGDPTTINSPLKGETTPEPDTPEVKKKRGPPRRNREPLKELDENAPRARRSTRRKKQIKKKYSGPYSDEFDDEYTYQMAKFRKRNAIRIHRDDSGPDITLEQQPISMSYLTSGFGYGPSLHQNALARDHYAASRSGTPHINNMQSANAVFRQNGPHDGALGQHSSSYDLSAFGQLTNFMRPSVYQGMPATGLNQNHGSLPSLPSFHQSFPNDPHLALPHMSMGMNSFSHPLPNWDVFNNGTVNADRHALPDSFSGFTGFDVENPDINPMFLHSDQGFAQEVEQPQPSLDTFIKQENGLLKQDDESDKESNADTISLASDQK